jgi:hypothetical protein
LLLITKITIFNFLWLATSISFGCFCDTWNCRQIWGLWTCLKAIHIVIYWKLNLLNPIPVCHWIIGKVPLIILTHQKSNLSWRFTSLAFFSVKHIPIILIIFSQIFIMNYSAFFQFSQQKGLHLNLWLKIYWNCQSFSCFSGNKCTHLAPFTSFHHYTGHNDCIYQFIHMKNWPNLRFLTN